MSDEMTEKRTYTQGYEDGLDARQTEAGVAWDEGFQAGRNYAALLRRASDFIYGPVNLPEPPENPWRTRQQRPRLPPPEPLMKSTVDDLPLRPLC